MMDGKLWVQIVADDYRQRNILEREVSVLKTNYLVFKTLSKGNNSSQLII
jgi:hypothetical protein